MPADRRVGICARSAHYCASLLIMHECGSEIHIENKRNKGVNMTYQIIEYHPFFSYKFITDDKSKPQTKWKISTETSNSITKKIPRENKTNTQNNTFLQRISLEITCNSIQLYKKETINRYLTKSHQQPN